MYCTEFMSGSSTKGCYKDPESGRPFDAFLNTLYIDGFLCDVNLKVGSTVIPAHRIILASACDFFENQFAKESPETLDLTSIFEDSAILDIVLKYIYKGEICLSKKIIPLLLGVLDKIDLISLKEHCAQFLMVRLRPLNGFETWELAWRHNLHNLATVCLILCRETLGNLTIQCECVKNLSSEFLKFVFNEEHIMININSALVIKLIIKWLSHTPTSRLSDAKHLLETFLNDGPILEHEYNEVNLFVGSYENLRQIITTHIDPLLKQHTVFVTSSNKSHTEIVDADKDSTQFDNTEANTTCVNKTSCSQEISRTSPVTEPRIKLEPKMRIINSGGTREHRVQDSLYTTMEGKCLEAKSEIILCNSRDPSDNYKPNWCALIQETGNQTLALYCHYNETWLTKRCPIVIHEPIGFVGDFLACRRNNTVIMLYNLEMFSWMILPSPFPAAKSKTEHILCLGDFKPAFFTYSGLLYSIYAVTSRLNGGLIFVLNKWESTESQWIYVTSIHPNNHLNDVVSMSLDVKTSTNSNVYLMATVTTLHSRKISNGTSAIFNHANPNTAADSKTSFNFSTKLDGFHNCSGNDTETKVSMKPNEIFYVFKIDMETLIHEEIGVRYSEPTYLDKVPALILEDRILFILDSVAKLHESFQYSFYHRKTYHINGLVLDLNNKNTWKGVALGIPLPPFYDLPITKHGKMCFAINITFSKNFVFIGMHRAPHIFQVAVYDVSLLEVNILSPMPLQAIRKMLLFSIDSHQPLRKGENDVVKDVDLLTYHFNDWKLKDWCGTVE